MRLNTLDQRVVARACETGLLDEAALRQALESLGPEPRPGSAAGRAEETLWSPVLQHLVDAGVLSREAVDRLVLQALLSDDSPPGEGEAWPASWLHSGLGRDLALDWEDVEIERLGHYRDLTFIGAGGQGRVYRAFDEHLERWVALKLLPASKGQAYLEEARTQAKVDHPNICKVFEVGEAPDLKGSPQPYIAMQLVQGRTLLGAALQRDEWVALLRDVALGVHAAHLLGLVHLDLKPGNILLERTMKGGWHAYVTDFGLLSGHGLIGTPPYCAPEQIRAAAETPDHRADVYGLGATLYVALSGSLPFEAKHLTELLQKIQHEEPTPLQRAAPSLPKDLSAIVSRAMAKQPADRYPTALALAEDLQRYLDHTPIHGQRVTHADRVKKWMGRNRIIAAALLLALVTVSVSGLWVWRSITRGKAEAAAAAHLGAEAIQMNALMQAAYLAPHHDLRPELAQVRSRMEAIRSNYIDVGKGPAAYAIGCGHVALGEWEWAVRAFESAWSEGYRSSDLALNMGRALGMVHRERLRMAIQAADAKQREAAIAKVNQEWLRPALEALEHVKGLSLNDRQMLAMWRADFQRKDAETIAQARKVNQETTADYQTWILHGARLIDVAEIQMGQEALNTLAEARTLLLKAKEVGRSHPEVYQALARNWYLQASLEQRTFGTFQPATVASLDEVSVELMGLNPDGVGGWIARSDALLLKARIASVKGEDCSPLLREVIQLGQRLTASSSPLDQTQGFERIAAACDEMRYLPTIQGQARKEVLLMGASACRSAMALQPRTTNAHIPLVQALLDLSNDGSLDGEQVKKNIEEALSIADTAVALEVRPLTARLVSGLAWRRKAEWLRSQGQDAMPALIESQRRFQSAWELAPQDPYPHHLLARSELEIAYQLLDLRQSPEASLEKAQAQLNTLLAKFPHEAEFFVTREEIHYVALVWDVYEDRDPSLWQGRGEASIRRSQQSVPPVFRHAFDAMLIQGAVAEARGLLQRGRNPGVALQRAKGLMEEMAKRNPGANLTYVRAESARILAAWQGDAAKADLLKEGVHQANQALAMNPNDLDARETRAGLYSLYLRFLHGEERRQALHQAQEDAAFCLKFRPRDRVAQQLVKTLDMEAPTGQGGPG